MNIQQFEADLRAENFQEIVTVEKPVGYALGEHQHPFDACALITQGAITLDVAGVRTTYAPGDVFRLPAGTLHTESAIPQGVTYRVGRRPVAAAPSVPLV
jgi:quercetin dioxygenase-like cupin family protein